MTERKGFPRPEEKHPDEEYRRDLNPAAHEGVNYGTLGAETEKAAPTAYDVKEAHNVLREFNDSELQQILVLRPGTRLDQGAVYVDLKDPQRREFTATGSMEAGSDNLYVPKSEVPYWIWNKLIGVSNPERLDAADEG